MQIVITREKNALNAFDDSWTFGGNGNYNNVSRTVHDQIDKANATVVVDPDTVTYDGHAQLGTVVSISGVNEKEADAAASAGDQRLSQFPAGYRRLRPS